MVWSLRQSWNHARARWLLGFALVLEFFEHRPMGCPFCGDVCHCTPELPVRDPCAPPSSQFQPNGNPVSNSSSPAGPVILDPEAHEASEERFSARLDASVDQPADAVHPRSPGAVMCGNAQSVSPGSCGSGGFLVLERSGCGATKQLPSATQATSTEISIIAP